ncbi:MAG TPA: superoxide dismutase [Cu-Zn] SodC [Candidatus Krumholzibacteria bacterium]|nr:superoxide dismutase [Cu-Zn] SodC [Candidatus Krumholzibacteria bacterium]
MKKLIGLACAAVLAATPVLADTLTITVHLTSDTGMGDEIGTIRAEDTPYGLLLTPALTGLTPGMHGFHVHENGSCDCADKDGKMVPGLAAGGHFDPSQSGKHLGPYADGHLGDLPPLYVAADGSATMPVLAPRLKVKDLAGRSVMIHAGGDNFSDQPAALGGGGARVACGVVTKS